jgi:hypothetical protein
VNLRSEISALGVVGAFGVSIGLVYAFFLPSVFPGYRTGWVSTLGILAAALIGGYIGYHVPTAKTLSVQATLGICYGTVVAILVSLLSLFILANLRWS